MSHDIELNKFPQEELETKDISQDVKDFLSVTGLPDFVAPHLYFGDFEDRYLPSLNQWPWACDWHTSYELASAFYPDVYVLGAAQNSEPIVLKHNDPSVYIFSSSGNTLQLLNTNLQKLLSTIIAFAEMIEAAVEIDKRCVNEKRIPHHFVANFIAKFRVIEPSVNVNESNWVSWASERSKNV